MELLLRLRVRLNASKNIFRKSDKWLFVIIWLNKIKVCAGRVGALERLELLKELYSWKQENWRLFHNKYICPSS